MTIQAFIDLSERAGPVLTVASDVYLRPLAASEVTTDYIDGINDLQINRFLTSAQNGSQTLDGVKEQVIANWRAHDAMLFGIFCSRIHCGNIRAHDVAKHRACICPHRTIGIARCGVSSGVRV